jgi:hypothetical protein
MEIKTYEKLTLETEELEILEKALDTIDTIEFLTRVRLKDEAFASYSKSVLNVLDDYIDRLKEMCEIE